MKLPRSATLDVLLAVGVTLTRLPFLFAGYGDDPDAWRVAWAGHEIARTGRYWGSRAPGNPILEFAAAALAGRPPWALNALTALMGTVAVVLFGMLLRQLGCRPWLAGALALAFTPVVAIHSADAMDYLWALAFLMAAWLAALDRRAGLSGLLVGVATGCRITSLAMLLPLSVVVAARVKSAGFARGRALSAMWGLGLFAAAVAFAPVFARSGLTFLHGYEHSLPRLLYLLKLLTVDVWGVIGCLTLASAAALVLFRLRLPAAESALSSEVDGILPAAAVAVAIELALFIRAPYEAGYLIPAVPFTLLLFARALRPREFMALCAGIALSAVLVKANEPNNLSDIAKGVGGQLNVGSLSLRVNVVPGPLMTDLRRREADVRYIQLVRSRVHYLRGPVAIVAGEWFPSLRVLIEGIREGDASYYYSLTRDQLDSLRRGGVAVLDLPSAEDCTQQMFGYSLRAAGSRALEAR